MPALFTVRGNTLFYVGGAMCATASITVTATDTHWRRLSTEAIAFTIIADRLGVSEPELEENADGTTGDAVVPLSLADIPAGEYYVYVTADDPTTIKLATPTRAATA